MDPGIFGKSMTTVKLLLDGLSRRVEVVEDRISELEDRPVEFF
jgi:hypothetical protein